MLPPRDLTKCRSVCRQWNRIIRDEETLMGKIWYRVDYIQRMRQTERCIQEAGKGNVEFFRFLVDIAPGLVTSTIFFSLLFWLKKLIELLGRYQQHIIYFCSFKQLSRFDQRRAFRADTAALFKGCQPQLVTLILARQRCKAGFLVVFR